jgi:dipeptidyl aminopeptidase/acylaminoacyl peptidase
MRADGANQTRLTNNAANDLAPAWSPDGSRIVFTSNRNGSFQLFVMNADGSGQSGITGGPGDVNAYWAPEDVTVGLVDPASGFWTIEDFGGNFATFFYGDPGDVPFMGDWDCDGIDTPGLFRQSDAFAYLRNSNTQGIADIRFFFGNPSDIPLAGDFDGDGCDSLSIYRPSEQRFYIINALGANNGGLGAADFSFLFGDPGDKPFTGDFDGDGIDEVGLHRESTGFVYYRDTLDTGIADNQFFFGDPGDRFVSGDWGVVDGTDTPGLFRPSNFTFYFRHTNTQGNADSSFAFGVPNWLPIAGVFE